MTKEEKLEIMREAARKILATDDVEEQERIIINALAELDGL
jgi:hypothetical protein